MRMVKTRISSEEINMSRKEIYVCDHCGKEIPVIKKKIYSE